MSGAVTVQDQLTDPYREPERLHMVPLWEIAPRLLPREPKPQAVPHLWRWTDIAPLAHRAASSVPIERGGERRVIAFMNPGLGGKWAATSLGARCADPPSLRPLSQQAYEANGGHQAIRRVFRPMLSMQTLLPMVHPYQTAVDNLLSQPR